MKKFKCFKTVEAAKIEAVYTSPDNGRVFFMLEGGETVAVTSEWVGKHDPRPGGYFVVYEDGYTSFSPAEAFEGGYADVSDYEARMRLESFDLGDRLNKLNTFIDSGRLNDLGAAKAGLLVVQAGAMHTYLKCLEARQALTVEESADEVLAASPVSMASLEYEKKDPPIIAAV